MELYYENSKQASVTQLVEYHVANVTVAGSNPVTRSNLIQRNFAEYARFLFCLSEVL